MKHGKAFWCFGVVALSSLMSAEPLFAGTAVLVYTSQSRRLSAEVASSGENPQGQPVTEEDQQTASAPDFGPFSAAIEAAVTVPFDLPGEFPDGGGLFTTSASVTQVSTLGQGGVSARGDMLFSKHDGRTGPGPSDTVHASADVEVGFTLTEPVKYLLLVRAFPGSGLGEPGVGQSEVLFRGPGGAVLAEEDSSTNVFEREGTLAPGDYFLDYHFEDGSGGLPGFSPGSYEVTLGVTRVIPLPPAVWAGGGLLACVAARYRRRRR